MRTIIEPFRIKSVEPITMSLREERADWLERVGWNLFGLPARQVTIDLLTDSGTGAMSSEQWAAIMRGDESYAGAESFLRFERAVRRIFGFEHVIPTHQGRAAEHLLFHEVCKRGDVVPSNTHFDTTRANVEAAGAVALDLPCPESADLASSFPFKGNLDVVRLAEALERYRARVPLVMATITNNAGGGQPLAPSNLRAVRELCDRHGVPLFLDACRFAENAHLVRERDPERRDLSLHAIARELFDLADGVTMSAKKDGLANIGGFLACRDTELARRLRARLVVTEGFPTYGGLAGRDLDAIAVGLEEVLDPDYQSYRHASIRYVCERLRARGIPLVEPPGGHAIFLDAKRFLPHVPASEYPGQALAIELYLEGGVRSCEIGSAMLARKDAATGAELAAPHELVRLAIPRRTYTQSHMDYVIEVVEGVWKRRDRIGGVAIEEAPPVLRHFTARFRRLEPAEVGS